MYIYYNEAPEEAIKVYSISDIKEHIASYMEPFFGDVEDETKDWDKEVEKWDMEDIRDWFIGNEIVLSKESPQELIENNYKKEGENKMLKPKKDEKELRKMIREHEEWLNTKGVKGKRLDLENENLQGLKFLNLDLRSANFKGADLTDCIIYADLREADLTGTKIKNTNFIGSNLNKTTIEADKLNLIEHQIKFEEDKHKSGLKSLKTSKTKQNDISK
ncbi:pentapeptide repeat-containing protein [Clostridium sp. N37]|uniref:Pentapeptide repeat-containing protein n=2 Tax=Clostridium faecium TaxID=2762223 RepID=A0ABR8YNU7_9CLOT|nr:pentapeptide repeat-containing protein [Clostridium faecium]